MRKKQVGVTQSVEWPRKEPSEMLWMRLLTVSRSSCCWRCSDVLLEETLISCCSNWPMTAVCRSTRFWSCSRSSWKIFSSTCRCSSMSLTFFSRILQIKKEETSWTLMFFLNGTLRRTRTYLFLLFSLLISLVWTISCFSKLLVDKEFSRSLRSSRVVWWITLKEDRTFIRTWAVLIQFWCWISIQYDKANIALDII